MAKVLVTLAMAFDMDEDRLAEMVATMDERMRAGIAESLENSGFDEETLRQFGDEFEYYGATVTLRRERVT